MDWKSHIIVETGDDGVGSDCSDDEQVEVPVFV